MTTTIFKAWVRWIDETGQLRGHYIIVTSASAAGARRAIRRKLVGWNRTKTLEIGTVLPTN